jgi:DNA-binding CsgD family transcriptional regulator
VAAWGFFLRAFTPKNERIKSCADALIYSNLLMIAVNVIAMNRSTFIGLGLSMLCLVIGAVFIWMLPLEQENEQNKTFINKTPGGIKTPLILLCLFVFIITINSGLMYQVINPAFEHLTGLVSWYWAVPYIVALAIMRNLPMKANRSRILYIGMAMIMGAFISFMLLGRNTSDYLIVDTLMLGACGIFDLFWWSILGEMLDYSDNPAHTFGMGLSANVFGVLCGGVLGMAVTSMGLPGAEVAVIALTVVCVTLVMLPPLNHQLVLLLKSHAYLAAYDNMSQSQRTDIVQQVKTLDPLTVREQEVLQLILSGKSNREIAGALFISENTVKTHARSVFSKYDVGSRAELISTLLKNQTVG